MAGKPKPTPKKILVADPEPDLLASLAASLTAAGYIVITAGDGDEAIALNRKEQPDLACVEIDLAGIDGLAVCRALKAERQVPVILAASRLDDRTSAGFIEVGAEDLLFKPYELDEVIDKVAWYLDPQ